MLLKVLYDDSDAVIWSLPGGKINFGEQPEEAHGANNFETLNCGRLRQFKTVSMVIFTNQSDGSNIYNLYII